MHRKPSVSFLIPAYNADKTIRYTIESVVVQTLKDIEIVIVDDGSTDETEKIVKSFDDERIKYIQQENSGVSSALNHGLKHCSSDLIARLDSDDIALPCRAEVQADYFRKDPKLILLGTAVNYVNMNNEIIGCSFPTCNAFAVKSVFKKRNVFAHPSVMFRKDAVMKVNGYDLALSGLFEDYFLWAKLLLIGKCKNIHKPLTNYRISEEQITAWLPSDSYKNLMLKIINNRTYDEFDLEKLKQIKIKDTARTSSLSHENKINAIRKNWTYIIHKKMNKSEISSKILILLRDLAHVFN